NEPGPKFALTLRFTTAPLPSPRPSGTVVSKPAGLCGYEIKNRGFTGFAAGGQKGFFVALAIAARPSARPFNNAGPAQPGPASPSRGYGCGAASAAMTSLM